MQNDSRDLLERYRPYQRSVEIGFWVALLALDCIANVIDVRFDLHREGIATAAWEPWTWEVSSHLLALALIPLVIAFSERVPLRWGSLRRSLPLHLIASVAYSLLHVAGMVALRAVVYRLHGERYAFGNWPLEWGYEYLKDVRSYATTLAIIHLYRLLLLRMQGEARLLDSAPGDAVMPADRPEELRAGVVGAPPTRFLVRMLGREFLIAVAEIEWARAAANYVNLRVRGRDYPLRITMTALEQRLDPARFRRVHRSVIVNLDFLGEIEPLEGGDARLLMRDGTRLACSRRYRQRLSAPLPPLSATASH